MRQKKGASVARDEVQYEPKTWWDRLWFRVGILEGKQQIVQVQIEERWGPIDEVRQGLLHILTSDELSALALAMLDFHNCDDLDRWLSEIPIRLSPVLEAVRRCPGAWKAIIHEHYGQESWTSR
jgi:hypothetical protein